MHMAAAASAVVRSAETAARVTSVYRRLLRHARRLPAADKAQALQQIKGAFRAGRGETSPDKIAEMLSDAHKRLGYLRIVTPKLAGDEGGIFEANAKSSGKQRYIVGQGGDLLPVDDVAGAAGRGATNAGVHSLDSQDVKRHVSNLRRFHFQDRPAGPFR